MPFKLIVIGASLGGMCALQRLLAALPIDLPAAVVVVQHRHPDSGNTIVMLLQEQCGLPVSEPEDKEPILSGRVYLAPANYHLLINEGYFSLSVDEPVVYARPSIDVLFESAADAFGCRTIGALLTGANQDGTAGLAAIKTGGGFTIAQDPENAECPIMPQAAIDARAVDYIMPLKEIGPFLVEICHMKAGV